MIAPSITSKDTSTIRSKTKHPFIKVLNLQRLNNNKTEKKTILRKISNPNNKNGTPLKSSFILNLIFSSSLGGMYLSDRFTAFKKKELGIEGQLLSPSAREVAAEPANQSCTVLASEIPNDWIFIEPWWVGGFNGATEQETLLKFDHIISKETKAKEFLLVIQTRTGWAGAGLWFGFNIRTSVKNGDKQYMHYTFGHRGDNNAAVWNSETVRFPIHSTRELRIKSNKVHVREFFIDYLIVGYRLQ